MKQIKWKTKALRQLRKIKNRQEQQKIYKEVGTLVKFPHCENVKKIKTTEMYESVDLIGFLSDIEAYGKFYHRHIVDIPRMKFFI